MSDMEFIVPSIFIDESDVGTRPTPDLSLSGIGIVGTFEWGPVNAPTTIGDPDQLVQVFGGNKPGLTGYKSAISAMKQGADDLRIVRIVGAGAAVATKAFTNLKGAFDLIITFRGAVEKFEKVALDKLNVVKSSYVLLEKQATTLIITAANEGAWGNDIRVKIDTATTVTLEGGSDGVEATDAAYIGTIDPVTGEKTGLKALEAVQCGITICAQQYSEAINVALINYCENAHVSDGLRIAVLNTPPGMSSTAVAAKTLALDSARGHMADVWRYPADDPDVLYAPDGFRAGLIAALQPHMSPSNKQEQGILKLEKNYAYAQVKEVTLAKVSPTTLVPNRGCRVRNGVTLASDTAWSQLNIRRQQDKMVMELYHAMQWAISEPHEPKLWNNVATQVDAYLATEYQLGRIFGYLPTICNAKVNPPEMIIKRILTFIMQWKPLYAADYILFKVRRVLPTVDDQQ